MGGDEALLHRLSIRLQGCGLMLRGGFHFDEGEEAPAGPDGCPARSLLLVGHAGDGYWQHFAAWRDVRPPVEDPLDCWAAEAIGSAAAMGGARAVFPSDRPWLPFQRWAMRAEGIQPSPLGILIHPDYGLWHAFRGALLFSRRLNAPLQNCPREHPCSDCDGRPCLSACPADAFSIDGFLPANCRNHLATIAAAPCREGGCLARNACPVGAKWRPSSHSQAFHLSAFARSV